MTLYGYWVGFQTIILKEIIRLFRIWTQTILPPVVTTVLYFVIFGNVIGSRVGEMGNFPYVEYIAPGLIMLTIINSSYSATVASFFSAKFQRNIEELLVSPLPNWVILLGFMFGGVIRGIIVGILVSIVAAFFAHLHLYSLGVILIVSLLSTCIFSLAGVLNAIFAKKFDDIAIIPTFILTPLIYLGGVFYAINLLPVGWRYISMINPIVYIVGAFRYGFLGINNQHLAIALIIMILFAISLFFIALRFLEKGIGLRY